MSNYPESVVINGDTYTDNVDECIVREGNVFTEDQNHIGYMWLTQDVVDKYKLNDEVCPLSEMYSDEELEDMIEEGDPKFEYSLDFFHCSQWLNPNTGKWEDFDVPTPFGELYSEEFVAWYNYFPQKLFELDKEDGVFHGGFCDG